MNWKRVIGIAMVFAVILIVRFGSAQPPQQKVPLIVGTWKLNLEKSGVRDAPPQFLHIRQYKLREDGFLVGLVMIVNGQGNPGFLQFTAKSDGKDYAEYSSDDLADMVATGKSTTHTYAEKIVDDYTTEWIDKENGKITAQGTKTISQDGKTMTLTVSGNRPQTLVFDRQ